MGRLLLLAMAAVGAYLALSASPPPAEPMAAAAPVRLAPVTTPQPMAAPTVAYRPGEPSLVPGEAATLTRAGNGHFEAAVEVNGQPTTMVVDTGATVVALTLGDAQRLGMAVDPARFTVVGHGASGPVTGQAVLLDDVAVGGRHARGVEAVVLDRLDRSLLGQSYLRRLERVEIDGDRMTLR